MTIAGVPTDVLRSSDLTWESLANRPLVFPPSAHAHSAADITSGTLSDSRLSSTIPRLNAANFGTLSTSGTITSSAGYLISTNGVLGGSSWLGLSGSSYLTGITNFRSALDVINATINGETGILTASGLGTHRFGPGSVSTVEMTAGVVRAMAGGGSWSQMTGLGLQSSGLLYLDAGASSGIMIRTNAANNNAVQFAADGSSTFYRPISFNGSNITLSAASNDAAISGHLNTLYGSWIGSSFVGQRNHGMTYGAGGELEFQASAIKRVTIGNDYKTKFYNSTGVATAEVNGATGAITASGDLILTGAANGIYLNPNSANTGLIYSSSGENRLNSATGRKWVVEGGNGLEVRGHVNIGANNLVSTYAGIYNDGKWLTGTDGYGSFYISPNNAGFAFAPPASGGGIVTTMSFSGVMSTLLGYGIGSSDQANTTVRYYANAGLTRASIRADDGLEVRNRANSADANLTVGAITASGLITGVDNGVGYAAELQGAASLLRLRRVGMVDVTLGTIGGDSFAMRNNGDGSTMLSINAVTKVATFPGTITLTSALHGTSTLSLISGNFVTSAGLNAVGSITWGNGWGTLSGGGGGAPVVITAAGATEIILGKKTTASAGFDVTGNLTASGTLGFSQSRFQQSAAQTLQTQCYDTSLAAWQETTRQQASPTGALVSLWGGTPSLKPPAYSFTNVTTRRSINCDASSVDELADLIATLYNDIKCLLGV